jgi:hypothetical protein
VKPKGLDHKALPHRRLMIEPAEPALAKPREGAGSGRKTALQRAERAKHERIVATTASLVARKDPRIPKRALLSALAEDGHQGHNITNAEIDPLSRKRMDDVGRIAEEHEPGSGVAIGMALPEGKGRSRLSGQDGAKPILKGLAKGRTKGLIIQRLQCARFRLIGAPHHGAAMATGFVIGEGQKSQGARGQKALPGCRFVRALGDHRGDNGALAHGFILGADAGHAAQGRLATIRRAHDAHRHGRLVP